MTDRFHANALLLSALLIALPFVGACRSTGPDKAASTVESMSVLESELQNVSNRIAKTLDALGHLIAEPQGDLRPLFSTFSKTRSELGSAVKSSQREAARVRSRSQIYYADWEATQATITSPEIKQRSEERRARMLKQQDEANAWIQAINQRLDSFATETEDIRAFLANDLNAGGIKAISGTAKSSIKTGNTLREDIDKLTVRLTEVRTATSARGSAAPE